VIDLGAVEGTVVTVDGNPVAPLKARQFPLAISQRVDIVVRVPDDGKAMTVLAKGEGRTLQTGVVRRPPGPAGGQRMDRAAPATPALTVMEEMKLRATQLYSTRPADQSIPVDLTGTMMGYVWGMDVHGQGGAPVTIAKGQRIELVMRNTTMMAHPMHLHGHS